MHSVDGLQPPLHAFAWSAAALPFAAGGGRATVRLVRVDEAARARLAAAAGFRLLLSLLAPPGPGGPLP